MFGNRATSGFAVRSETISLERVSSAQPKDWLFGNRATSGFAVRSETISLERVSSAQPKDWSGLVTR
jgi:hypothetical protein